MVTLPISPLAETALLSARERFLEGNRATLEIKRKFDRLPLLRNPFDNAALTTRDRRSAYITQMGRQIDAGFPTLVNIALANRLQVGGSSAKWAQEQFAAILRDALAVLPTWLMYICEGKEVQADGWCGPRWLDMRPLGSSNFVCEKQWDKLTVKETSSAVERICKFVNDSLNRHLLFVAGRRITSEASIQSPRPEETPNKKAAAGKGRSPKKRTLFIRGLIDERFSIDKYCEEMDKHVIKPPKSWGPDCPSTYKKIYAAGDPWLQKVHRERSNANRGR